MRKYLKGGDERVLSGKTRCILYTLILAAFGYGIWSNFFSQIDPYVRNAGFITLLLAALFMVKSPFKGVAATKVEWYDYLIIMLVLYIGGYIFFHGDRYVERFPIVDELTANELMMGGLLLFISLESARRTLGLVFTSLILLLAAYFFFGHYIPGSFSHKPLGFIDFVDYMAFTIDGIFGSIATISATYVFVFLLFGAFLDKAGAGEFFLQIAMALTGRQRGGVAKVAVISSGLFGMISGSPVSDVVTTGSFTIPMMKKAGYGAALAGAIEAVASCGGSIMPPVMGSAALLMTELAGVPLNQVIIAAAIPAILYYFSVYMQVHFHSVKYNMKPNNDGVPKVSHVLLKRGYYIIPFVLLIYFLLNGYTPQFAAGISMVCMIALSWIRKETRMGLKEIFESIVSGISHLLPLVSVVTGAGLLIGCINTTGIGGKLMSLISSFTGDHVIFALILTALICIVLGMGLPTVAAYVLTAVITAPALIQLGIPAIQAHLFIVYFTLLSGITPPICVAAYSASTIAQADPISIGWKACRLGISAYIVPFLFVFNPELNFEGELGSILIISALALIGILALASSLEGILVKELSLLERGLLFAAAWLIFISGTVINIVGIVIIFIIFVLQLLKRRRDNQLSAAG